MSYLSKALMERMFNDALEEIKGEYVAGLLQNLKMNRPEKYRQIMDAEKAHDGEGDGVEAPWGSRTPLLRNRHCWFRPLRSILLPGSTKLESEDSRDGAEQASRLPRAARRKRWQR